MSLAAQNSAPTPLVGGREPVFLHASGSSLGHNPHFLNATLLPGRGMNWFQARAFVPGLGEIDVLRSPSLQNAVEQLNGGSGDFMGIHSFRFGGAILLPFANRIRGRLLPGGCAIETRMLDRDIRLPADWHGKRPDAEKCAMHGLMLASKMDVAEVSDDHVTAILDAGDFDGHWPSTTHIQVGASLRDTAIELSVMARNTGDSLLPVGIGWHPYFSLPSGKRAQARLHLPAHKRALVNNYDDVFPTGQIEPVAGTPYNFTGTEGAALGHQYFDDSLVDLDKRADGCTQAEIFDPESHYGVRLIALSSEVRAFQVYSPPDKPFVVVEPQFNLADPFSSVWPKQVNTGMVILKPGQEVTWAVRVELFTV
jgi:galactose mutarotase-like enzyme